MIGLILGNLTAMIFWMIVGFKTGVQVGYSVLRLNCHGQRSEGLVPRRNL